MVTDPIYLKNWELFFQHYYGYRTYKISNYVFSFYRVTDSTYLFKNYLYKRPARAAETNEIQVLQRSGIWYGNFGKFNWPNLAIKWPNWNFKEKIATGQEQSKDRSVNGKMGFWH